MRSQVINGMRYDVTLSHKAQVVDDQPPQWLVFAWRLYKRYEIDILTAVTAFTLTYLFLRG